MVYIDTEQQDYEKHAAELLPGETAVLQRPDGTSRVARMTSRGLHVLEWPAMQQSPTIRKAKPEKQPK